MELQEGQVIMLEGGLVNLLKATANTQYAKFWQEQQQLQLHMLQNKELKKLSPQ
jgi:hypothetical protein